MGVGTGAKPSRELRPVGLGRGRPDRRPAHRPRASVKTSHRVLCAFSTSQICPSYILYGLRSDRFSSKNVRVQMLSPNGELFVWVKSIKDHFPGPVRVATKAQVLRGRGLVHIVADPSGHPSSPAWSGPVHLVVALGRPVQSGAVLGGPGSGGPDGPLWVVRDREGGPEGSEDRGDGVTNWSRSGGPPTGRDIFIHRP